MSESSDRLDRIEALLDRLAIQTAEDRQSLVQTREAFAAQAQEDRQSLVQTRETLAAQMQEDRQSLVQTRETLAAQMQEDRQSLVQTRQIVDSNAKAIVAWANESAERNRRVDEEQRVTNANLNRLSEDVRTLATTVERMSREVERTTRDVQQLTRAGLSLVQSIEEDRTRITSIEQRLAEND